MQTQINPDIISKNSSTKGFDFKTEKLLQRCPYENLLLYIYSLRKLGNNQETTMISYAKYKTKLCIVECSTSVSVLPEFVQSFFWHEKESTR